MKLLEKLKNAIFEDDEFEELEKSNEELEEVKKEVPVTEVVKKIDIEKTIPKKIELPKDEEIGQKPLRREQHRKTPVIFNEEDFVMEEKKLAPKKETIKREEPKKPLYGGYKDEKPREKFKPSPVISPVYGFVGVSPVLEKPRNDEVSSFNEMFAKEKKPEVTLDTVRQKAFGIESVQEDDDLGLLYDMKNDDAPAISKITLGDAEEYFDDLGLEYNVDYKDSAKEKEMEVKKSTRSTKNKELSQKVEEEIKTQKELESTKELEITKEQLKPKTAKEIKKVKKIADSDLGMKSDGEEPEEKNLYDLIDMMYETK
ncbi:MAG: hypothetical protein ACI4PE_04735 [Bacilli bacterium]